MPTTIINELDEVSKSYDQRNDRVERARAMLDRRGEKGNVHKRDLRRLTRAVVEQAETVSRHRRLLDRVENGENNPSRSKIDANRELVEENAKSALSVATSLDGHGHDDLAEDIRKALDPDTNA